MTSEAVAEQKLCAKCGKGPATSQTWCKECRAKYQKEWRDRECEMIGARNWNRGMAALRAAMVANMGLCPDYQFKARDVTEWLRTFPAPEYPSSEQPVKE